MNAKERKFWDPGLVPHPVRFFGDVKAYVKRYIKILKRGGPEVGLIEEDIASRPCTVLLMKCDAVK